MSVESNSLFSLARNKLQSVVGGNVKDSCSLHRWVLLKNSIIRSHTPTPSAATVSGEADTEPAHIHDEEVFEEEDDVAYMFPDPHAVHTEQASANDENQWLDALLEDLEDDEEEPSSAFQLPAADYEEPLSPLYSPMSSSDDLVDQANFYSYPIPYPPLHPPLVPAWYELETSTASMNSLPVTPALYDNPLPYYDVDDFEATSVPDAIDDLSDDESDAPPTPSSGSAASISPPSSTSVSMQRERTRLPLTHPQVYVEMDEPSYYPFELDPLPFPDQSGTSPHPGAFHAYVGSC
jgi:hypothetical protein